MNKKNLGIRLACYFAGFIVMTAGIAISVKSDLGVSPVSSIPYTMTCIWGIEMGKATIIFHLGLVALQILLLRRQYKPVQLLQIPVGIIFGYCTTFCNYMVSFWPAPESMVIRLIMLVVSAFLIAFGIFLYVPPRLIPIAGEGAMLAVQQVTGKPFSSIKIAFDVSMVAISLASCLFFIHRLGSVGIGTIVAAFLVGFMLKCITKVCGKTLNRILGK